MNVALYHFFSNKSKNKSCSVYYKGTFCFSLCLPSLNSLAAREKDLSDFVLTKIFFNTNPTTVPILSSFLYNNMKKSY